MTEELSFYFDKCRCCHESAEGADHFLINKNVEKRFYFVSEVELKSSSLLSSKICSECWTKIEAFWIFKQELVYKQEKLYKLLEDLRVTEHLEELLEDAPSDNDEVKLSVYEDDTDVKEEPEYLKQAVEFEYEVHSVAQLDFDNFESEDTIATQHKKRNRKDPFRNAGISDEVEQEEEKTENRRFSCPECQKYFSDKNKVRLHVQRVHKQIKNHNCDECEYKAHSKYDILRHMKTQHMPKETDPKDLRICPDCGKVLKGNNHLNFHIKTKHLKLTKYSCDLCDFKSYGKYEIRSHIEIHHLPLELRKGFACDLCPSVLTTAMSLKTHKTHKHSGLRPHLCFCGKAYALRETLKSHIRNVHNGERKYKCPHCEKGFNSNPRLNDHVNNNHGTKQEIPCDKCGKVFNSLRNLQTHMVYHQTPSLKCNYCEKLFYIKKNLREHESSVHLGITYGCDLCSRSFQSTSGLRRHAKSHC